jgi:hypothetical protein
MLPIQINEHIYKTKLLYSLIYIRVHLITILKLMVFSV